MNHSHLGDSFDFWKLSVVSLIRSAHPLGVIPMFTDSPCDWNGEITTYSNFLGGNVCILSKAQFNRKQRGNSNGICKYFVDVERELNGTTCPFLFVDPDTGIRNSGQKKHIRSNEVNFIVNIKRVALVMIYDHSKIRGVSEEDHREHLGKDIKHSWGVLSCGQVRMFFSSRLPSQILKVEKVVTHLLGSLAEQNWSCTLKTKK